jgi:hypothetical protein
MIVDNYRTNVKRSLSILSQEKEDKDGVVPSCRVLSCMLTI